MYLLRSASVIPFHQTSSMDLDCKSLFCTCYVPPAVAGLECYCRPKLAIASASAQVSASWSVGRCLASMSHVAAISTKCCLSSGFAASLASLRHSSARLVQSVEVRMRTLSPDAMRTNLADGRQYPGRLMPKILGPAVETPLSRSKTADLRTREYLTPGRDRQIRNAIARLSLSFIGMVYGRSRLAIWNGPRSISRRPRCPARQEWANRRHIRSGVMNCGRFASSGSLCSPASAARAVHAGRHQSADQAHWRTGQARLPGSHPHAAARLRLQARP